MNRLDVISDTIDCGILTFTRNGVLHIMLVDQRHHWPSKLVNIFPCPHREFKFLIDIKLYMSFYSKMKKNSPGHPLKGESGPKGDQVVRTRFLQRKHIEVL